MAHITFTANDILHLKERVKTFGLLTDVPAGPSVREGSPLVNGQGLPGEVAILFPDCAAVLVIASTHEGGYYHGK